MDEHILLNKTILGIKIAEDKQALRFDTDCGEVIARTDGECCSRSWVENVELPVLGFPAKVLLTEDIDLPDAPETPADEYEVIKYYGFKITTDKGDIVIDYRNSSNGYYGGNLSWPGDDYFYGGVYGQNNSNRDWREIKEDK